MTSGDACIAVDWGTTNRRACLMAADGRVIDGVGDDRGVIAVPRGDYAGEIAAAGLATLPGDRIATEAVAAGASALTLFPADVVRDAERYVAKIGASS